LKADASFAHILAKPGDIALVSQSGAITAAMLDWAAVEGVGFSHVVSIGDAADVDTGDMLDYLAGDVTSRAVFLYIEAIRDAAKFMSAARRCSRAKPVIAIKAGRHPKERGPPRRIPVRSPARITSTGPHFAAPVSYASSISMRCSMPPKCSRA